MSSEVFRDEFYTFDIETTTIITGVSDTQRLQYEGIIWSGQFYNGKEYAQVRDLQGIREKFREIEKTITDENERVVIFCHNLSYEFQFIKNLFEFTNILAYSPRKVISATTNSGLVFRCSYILTNMSLKKFLESEGVETQKTEMDYSIRRLPTTPLSELEKEYCKNDVVGLWQAIDNRISQCFHGSIRYLPLTSTGYVRRDCKKAMKKDYRNRLEFKKNRLSYEQYCHCREAFRGGNVHANRYHVGQVLENVFSVDKASSYPFELMTKKFPTKFYKMRCYKRSELDYFLNNDYALLFRWSCRNLTIRENVYNPYIPSAKCLHLSQNHNRDNGRVLNADFLSITLTEIDYKIICKQYQFSEERFDTIYYSKKKELPKELKEVIMEYYEKKTSLKGVEGEEYFYNRSKAYINSIYGMFVTSIVKPEYDFIDGCVVLHEDDKTLEQYEIEKLKAFYQSFNSFLSYQIGIWVTAYAREGLQELIDVVGSDFLYADTDSVKGVNYEKHKKSINQINTRIKRESYKQGAVAKNKDGKDCPMGVWEFEGISEKFKTFGSKKYIYGNDENFKITIAGVPKQEGIRSIKEWENETGKKWYDIDIGFEFHNCKLASQYHDYQESKFIEIDGENIEISSNIGLYEVNYILGYASDFEKLIRFLQKKVEGETYE